MVNQNYNVKMKTFIYKLRALIDNLPSNEQKKETEQNINAIIEFLTYIRNIFQNLPSLEDMENVKNVLEKMEDILLQVKSNPLLASLLKLPGKGKTKRPIITEENIKKAKSIIKQFDSLSLDEIKNLLNAPDITLSCLRALALQLGFRSVSKLSKSALIHQIYTNIANYRGYQKLGEKENQS